MQRGCLSKLHCVWGSREHPDVAIATNNSALFADTAEEAADMYERAQRMSGSQHHEFEHNLLTARGDRPSISHKGEFTPLREAFDAGDGRVFWQLNHVNLACGVSMRQLLE